MITAMQKLGFTSSVSVFTWYGMVWYGMVWYGMVWYGMVWYGMVW
jgi:chloride channel 2